ncbi:MAG: hypothetical protein P8166_07360 [Candidatus Thiodiazotropha sp.]
MTYNQSKNGGEQAQQHKHRPGEQPLGCSPVHPLGLVQRPSIAYSAERTQYYDSTNLPLKVSLVFVLQRPKNTMKSTIGDSDNIVD